MPAPPVAVDVRDHACRDAREPAAEHAERRLLRALGEHGVRPERAQLARHAKREKRVERRSVERPRPDGRTSRKRGSAPVRLHPTLASTRTSSSAERASNFCASDGRSGSEYRDRPTMSSRFFTRPPSASSASIAREDRLLRVALDRSRSGASAGARRKGVVAEEAPDRVGERRGVAGRHEQAVLAVADDLRHAADGGRDHRTADGERLDDRVREVLPGGREHGGVGGAEEAKDRLARDAAEEAHARVEPELAHSSLERQALRPVAGDHERHVRRCGERLERDAERLLRAEPAGEHEDVARRARARREARRATASAGSRARDSAEPRRAPGRAPNAARRRGGTRSGRRRVARPSAPRSASRAGSAPDRLLRRAGTRRASRRSGRSASRARRPRRTRASRRAASARAGRRSRLAGSCSSRRRRRRGALQRERAAQTARGAAAIDAQPSAPDTAARPAPQSAVVTTSTSCPRSARKSASAGAWLAGPPASGGQIPETTTTLTAGAPAPLGSPPCTSARRRAITTSQAPANTSVETRTATAAPVAPHSAPSTATSGIATSVSSPCVTIRSRGRPIVTGSDFVQPSAKWIAAGEQDRRARPSTAPSYSEPKTTRTSHGMATKKTGTATTISAPAHFE